MIALIGSIVFSSFIFILFKLFPRFGIDTFQAIVFNYFTAFVCGFVLYGESWSEAALSDTKWMYAALICGILFISLFMLMGRSSQINGVAITSVAVKMSMALSAIFIGIGESFGIVKIAGIVMAIIGVILVSFDRSSSQQRPVFWMLLVLFFGSGLLDFILNFVQKSLLTNLSAALFSAIGFGLAGIFGVIMLLKKVLETKTQLSLKNVLAGIFLGIPNFFSIYLLITAYSSTGWSDSTVLAVVNVSIVITSAILGFLAFKEALSNQKLIGLVCSILAIGLLYAANL
jgi:drug/metabolite transporter (DMT)-like permease